MILVYITIYVAIWVGVALISAIVHEIGHMLTFRYFGYVSGIEFHKKYFCCVAEPKTYEIPNGRLSVIMISGGLFSGLIFLALNVIIPIWGFGFLGIFQIIYGLTEFACYKEARLNNILRFVVLDTI